MQSILMVEKAKKLGFMVAKIYLHKTSMRLKELIYSENEERYSIVFRIITLGDIEMNQLRNVTMYPTKSQSTL